MRSAIKFALLSLLWTATAVPVARAQAAARTQSLAVQTQSDDAPDGVLMSVEQGQALADFALHSGPRVRPKPDCSHLVHLLYARAGLIYPYEDSRVLYRGIAGFERVKTPQPGDLAVWLGHVGIVLSPEDKTFLSSVRSGIITETWTAAHWKRRGRPRFLRYRISEATNVTLLAAIMDRNTVSPLDSAERPQISVEQPSDVQQSAPEVAAETRANVETPAQQPHGFLQDDSADARSIVATIHQRSTPSKRQVAVAITESCNARARRLIDGETVDLDHPLSVFDQMEVTRLQIKHESGTVTLQMSETVSQEVGKILQARNAVRELTIVRHSDGVWVISDPRGRTYIPQSQALEVFERQAALFLARAPNSTSTRTVVKALDRIYDQQPGAPRRAAIR
jgi:hypothetical protein